MTNPSNRVGDDECRVRSGDEPVSQAARLRRKARPASLAIVIGSLLAFMVLHTIWSNCSAESGTFLRLSDTGQPGQPAAGLSDRLAPAAGAVVPATYVADERDPSRTTGAPIVTPETYRPKLALPATTTDRRDIWGDAVAPRVVPKLRVRPQVAHDRDRQPLPDVVIAPPESGVRPSPRTILPSTSQLPTKSIGFADERSATSQPAQTGSVPPYVHPGSTATAAETLVEPANSIRLADRDRVESGRGDRPTRWKIEARPPLADGAAEELAAGNGEPKQIVPPTDETDQPPKPPNTISLRLRDDRADPAAPAQRDFPPRQEALALPSEETRSSDEANGPAPLREVLPIRWTIGGAKSSGPETASEQETQAVAGSREPASTSSTEVGNGAASRAEIARLRFAPRDVTSAPDGAESPESTVPNREKTAAGWSTHGDDASGRLRLVYEDATRRETSPPPRHQSPVGPALRIVDEGPVQTAPVIELGGSPPPEKANAAAIRLSIKSQPEERIAERPSPALDKPEETISAADRWVAVPRSQGQSLTENPPPRPPSEIVAQKSPDGPSVGESLAKRFTTDTIGWKVISNRPATTSVATKAAAKPSGSEPSAARPAIADPWSLKQKPDPARLALQFATEQPEPPPDDSRQSPKRGGAGDATNLDLAPTSGPRDLADVFALPRGEPVVPATRNDSLSAKPAENAVPFAFDDGGQPPTQPRAAIWRPTDDTPATKVDPRKQSDPNAVPPGPTRLAIVQLDLDAAKPRDPVPANSKTPALEEIPLAVAQAQEGTEPSPADVDNTGTAAPASQSSDPPKLLARGLASKPITQVSVDITPPVDDSPLGNEFPDEVRLPWDVTDDAPLVDESFTRGWDHADYAWEATGLSHRPLYFEQVNFERYGYAPTRSRTGQSILAGAHFFGSVLILPYRMGAEPMNESVYTLGQYRPGSYVPYRTEWPPLDWKGGALETVTLMGLIIAIP